MVGFLGRKGRVLENCYDDLLKLLEDWGRFNLLLILKFIKVGEWYWKVIVKLWFRCMGFS